MDVDLGAGNRVVSLANFRGEDGAAGDAVAKGTPGRVKGLDGNHLKP